MGTNNNASFDFIIIGCEDSWETADFGHRSRMIPRALSAFESIGKILVVNCPVSLFNRIRNKLKGKTPIERLYPVIKKSPMASLLKINEKLYMLSLTSLFPEASGFFSYWERCFLAKKVNKITAAIAMNAPKLIIVSPRMIDFAKRTPLKVVIFDAVDNLLLHPSMKRLHSKIRAAYRWIEDNAKMIIIASEKQKQMFAKQEKLFLLPNGVDYPLFNSLKSTIPQDIKGIPPPIAGYAGVLQERFDVDQMEYVIKNLPGYNFVFVGPVKTPGYFRKLYAYKNAHFLGYKKHSDIPSYINRFDVAIIPHLVNDFTDSMDPLKVYEYFACGKPVVSTAVSGVSKFGSLIETASDGPSFSSAIIKAASENNRQSAALRRDLAVQNSWDKRMQVLLKGIREIIQ